VAIASLMVKGPVIFFFAPFLRAMGVRQAIAIADFTVVRFTGVRFTGVHLTVVHLTGVHLTGAVS